jgi:hypothetical protein
VAFRSPQLYEALRLHCLGAFSYLYRESQSDAPLTFSFEEHAAPGRPALYEYRPRARSYVEDRAEQLRRLDDAQFALEELRREPAVAIFAHAHSGSEDTTEESALYRTILLPFLAGLAERCGGFEWDDQVFNGDYRRLEHEIFGESHAYSAVAPLVGISCPVPADLGGDLRLRLAEPGEIADYWPEANGLLPAGFGQQPERASVVELSCVFPAGSVEPPDAAGEIADAVTALRLATAAPIAAGPVLFERLDRRPYGVRAVLPIAATEPPGEPTRLDEFRARLAADLAERLSASDLDEGLGEALDRWELSLFASEPYRSEQLRESLGALLGGGDGLWAAAARLAVLVGEDAVERAELFARLRGLTSGGHASKADADMVRRALLEVVMTGDRVDLLERLDDSLLGLKPRPRSFLGVRSLAS